MRDFKVRFAVAVLLLWTMAAIHVVVRGERPVRAQEPTVTELLDGERDARALPMTRRD